MKLTTKQQKAFDKARFYFRYAAGCQTIKAFRKKVIEDYGFYDGTGQWNEEQKESLLKSGCTPQVFNVIKPHINSLTSVDVQTRFRVAFRSHSNNEDDDLLAKAVTHLAYSIQENQDMTYKSTAKFMDVLITGVGWSNVYRDPNSGEIQYEHVHPLDVLFDPDDLSAQLNQSEFVIRMRWVPLSEVEKLWPQHKDYFESRFDDYTTDSSQDVSPEIQQRREVELDNFYLGSDYGRRIRVIEVQYREAKTSYQAIDQNGHFFSTFNEEEAKALAGDKEPLQQKHASEIMRVLFCDDRLLEFAPLHPSLPDLPDFTYIPCLWSRRCSDAVPDGWLSSMKPVQRQYNALQTKLLYMLNSTRAIYEHGAFNNKTPQEIEAMLRDPSAAIEIMPNTRFELHPNSQISGGYFTLLEKTIEDVQRVSGYYDEALGKQTNAQSGVAIKARQVNSVRGQAVAFDNLKLMKKREARMMLNLIQSSGEKFIESRILNEEEQESILLNVVKEIKGQRIILNNIRTLPLSIYVEEVPDFESPSQEQQATLEALLSNPNAMMILQSPELLKRLGVRDYQDVARDFQALQQKAQAQKQAAQGQQGAQGQISPEQIMAAAQAAQTTTSQPQA
jgi:hypothetical protein